MSFRWLTGYITPGIRHRRLWCSPADTRQPVGKPVDNLCEMRITACFLWSLPWIAEQKEMAGRRALRGACGGSNNAFTAGNGHHPVATPGTREEPGDRPLARVPGPGGRRAARGEDQAAGQSARRGRARPLHLIHGGAVPDSARRERLAGAGTRHPGNRGDAGRDDRGPGRARTRFPGGRAGPQAVCARAAGPAPGPCRTAGVRARMTGCRAVASRDASGGQRPGTGRCRGGDLLSPVAGGVRRLPFRLVVVLAQAGGPAPAAAEPGQRERIEDASPARSR
jgi:hypothetical protein